MPLCVSCSVVTPIYIYTTTNQDGLPLIILDPIYIKTNQGTLPLTVLSQKLRVGSWALEEVMGRELEGSQLDKELA